MNFAKRLNDLLTEMERDGTPLDRTLAANIRGFVENELVEAAGGPDALMLQTLLRR